MNTSYLLYYIVMIWMILNVDLGWRNGIYILWFALFSVSSVENNTRKLNKICSGNLYPFSLESIVEHILATTNESRLGDKVSIFSQHFQDCIYWPFESTFVLNNDAILFIYLFYCGYIWIRKVLHTKQLLSEEIEHIFSCNWSLHTFLLFSIVLLTKNYKLIWPALIFFSLWSKLNLQQEPISRWQADTQKKSNQNFYLFEVFGIIF